MLVGLLWRPGARACPNLPQRRSGPRSAAKKSPEYQRFFSRAPARSGPLWQIWTTRVAANPREGRHGPVGGRDRPLEGPPQAGRRPQRAPRRANRAHRPRRRPPRTTPRLRNVHFALESAVPTVILECKMHLSAKKRAGRSRRGPRRRPRGPRRPRPPSRRFWRERLNASSARRNPPQLAPCELSSHHVSSARQNPPQLDSCELSSHNVS